MERMTGQGSDKRNSSLRVSRRTIVTGAALTPAAALVPAAALAPASAQAQTVPAGALTEAQLEILKAFMDRLIPADELGPGAVEAEAWNYVDMQLAGYLEPEKDSFVEGLEAMDAYARRAHGAPMAELSAAQRDQVLTAMDSGDAEGFPEARQFFGRARRLTLEGMFGDPYYGGNKGFAGWDLIRYPGPRMAVEDGMQRMDELPEPYRRSAWGSGYGE